MISSCASSGTVTGGGGYLTGKGSSASVADLDALNPLPPPLSYAGSYGNTSNAQLSNNNSWSTYNNSLQYPSCGSNVVSSVPGQYSSTPTMVLYPQLYSTVNQNQIHLHLHATATPDKIEQYLGSATTTTTSAVALEHSSSSALAIMPTSTGGGGGGVDRLEIGIGTEDNNINIGGRQSGEMGVGYERGSGVEGVTQMDTGDSNNNIGQTDPTNHRRESRDAITTESVWRPY